MYFVPATKLDAVENTVGDHNLPDFLQMVECGGNLGIFERLFTHRGVDASFNRRQRRPAKKDKNSGIRMAG